MNAVIEHLPHNAEISLSAPMFIRQGCLVTFSLPYATTLNLTGRLQGIVLSRHSPHQDSRDAIICPILCGKNSVNETLGIKFQTDSPLESYLRPDLTSTIGISYGRVVPILKRTGQPCLVDDEKYTQAAIRKLIDIIKPTEKKFMQTRRQSFLGYGEIGKAHGFPRADENINEQAPILNLTPPEIYQQTGMAILIRGLSNKPTFNPKYDVGLPTSRWFKEGFFAATQLRILPIQGILAQRLGWRPISAGQRALKAVEKKLEGLLDAKASGEVVRRYDTPRGDMKRYFYPTNYGKKNTCHLTPP